MVADDQTLSSLVWVPDLSPRLANGALGVHDRLEGVLAGAHAGDLGGVVLRADDDEVVVHHVETFFGEAIGHELVLGLAAVDQQHIGITFRADLDRLARTHSDYVNLTARQLLEIGQDEVQEPRIGGAGGGRQDQPGRIVSLRGLRRLGRLRGFGRFRRCGRRDRRRFRRLGGLGRRGGRHCGGFRRLGRGGRSRRRGRGHTPNQHAGKDEQDSQPRKNMLGHRSSLWVIG